MIIVFVFVGVVGWEIMPPVMKDRIMYTFTQREQAGQRQIGGASLDTSTSARLTSYQEVFDDVVRSPIWGFGVTGYGFLDAQYPRVIAESGLLGVVTFGIMVFAIFRLGYKVMKTSSDGLYRGLSMGLFAGLVGLMVHGLGANTFIIVRIMEPFWLLVGLVVSGMYLESKSSEKKEEVTAEPESLPTLPFRI